MSIVSSLPYQHPYRWEGVSFGIRRLWRPIDLGSSLALWLDADDNNSIILNGSTASQWRDKSGNSRHANQSTAASQPRWGVNTNLLSWSEDFTNSAWTRRGTVTVTANDAIAPDGTMTADRLSGLNTTTNDIFNTDYLTSYKGMPGTSYTPSIYIKRISTSGTFTIGNTINDILYGRWTVDLSLLPDAWVRLSATTTGVTVNNPFVFDPNGCGGILLRGVTGGPLSMHIWGAQANLGPSMLTYQRTETTNPGINGRAAMLWSGANNILMDTGAWNLSTDRKFASVSVAASPSWNTFRRIWISLNGYQFGYVGTGGTANTALALAGGWTDAGSPLISNTRGANIVSAAFGTTGVGTDIMAININGGTDATRSGGTGGLGTAGIRLGADSTVTPGGFPWDGQMGELVIVSGDLSVLNRRRLEGYMAWKWGLVANLPANHPFRFNAPTI